MYDRYIVPSAFCPPCLSSYFLCRYVHWMNEKTTYVPGSASIRSRSFCACTLNGKIDVRISNIETLFRVSKIETVSLIDIMIATLMMVRRPCVIGCVAEGARWERSGLVLVLVSVGFCLGLGWIRLGWVRLLGWSGLGYWIRLG